MIAVLVTFAFAGGDLGDLARTVAAWTHEPTVAFVEAQRAGARVIGVGNGSNPPEWKSAPALKPFGMSLTELGDGKDFVRLTRVRTGLESRAKAGGVALWPAAWEPSTTFPEGVERVPPLPDGWRPVEDKDRERAMRVEGGRATFDLPPAHAVLAGQAARLPWSKPVRMHWLLAKFWVVPAGTHAGERETLGALAAAISGRLVETKNEYRIDLDPAAFRLRALAHVASRREFNSHASLARAHYRVLEEAWNDIDDGTILNVYSRPWGGVGVDVPPGSPLSAALSLYLATLQEYASNPPPDLVNSARGLRGLLNQVDPDGVAKVIVGQNMGVSAGLPRKGGGTVIP